MGSSVRILLSLVVLVLLGVALWWLGCWPLLPGPGLLQALQQERALAAALEQSRHRNAVAERIEQRLLAGELHLREAVRELRALSAQPPRAVPEVEVKLAGSTPELRMAFHLVRAFTDCQGEPSPNRDAVLARLRLELKKMQETGR